MDDGFLGHHKVRRAVRSGWEALGMWTALRTYVAKFLTDGFIPDEEIDLLQDAPKNPRKWLKVLVECGAPTPEGGRGSGLVDRVPGGWLLHDYLDHALPAEEIKRRRKAAAERQKRWRNGPRDASQESDVTHNETHNETRTQRVSNASPSHPIPKDLDLPDNSVQRPDRLEPSEPTPPAAPRAVPSHVQRFERAMSGTKASAAATELFEAYRSESGKTGAKFDHRAQELFEQLVEDHVTVGDVRLAVRGAKLDHWATHVVKLAASPILAADEQRAKFIALARDPPRPKGTKAPRQPSDPDGFGSDFMNAANGGTSANGR